MVNSKFSTNVHLASWPTSLGVPAAVGHGVRGAANGRQYWPVGSGSCRCGHRRQEPAYIRGRAPAAIPSFLPHFSLQTFGFQPLRSAF
jgi:hypothetical protein